MKVEVKDWETLRGIILDFKHKHSLQYDEIELLKLIVPEIQSQIQQREESLLKELNIVKEFLSDGRLEDDKTLLFAAQSKLDDLIKEISIDKPNHT